MGCEPPVVETGAGSLGVRQGQSRRQPNGKGGAAPPFLVYLEELKR